jgi:hypothetical protein
VCECEYERECVSVSVSVCVSVRVCVGEMRGIRAERRASVRALAS